VTYFLQSFLVRKKKLHGIICTRIFTYKDALFQVWLKFIINSTYKDSLCQVWLIFIVNFWCFQGSLQTWFLLWIVPFTWSGHWFWLGIFPFTWMNALILTAVCSVYLIWRHWFPLPDFAFEMGLMTGATVQQGMLTPSTHMIPPPVCPEVHVSPFFLRLVIPTGVSRLITLWCLGHFIHC
jgi:hypothetical protein